MTSHSQSYLPGPRLFLFVLLVAIISPLPYAGSWNDGSRLASVEALVDYHTWSIDHSIFVKTPGVVIPRGESPYPADDRDLVEKGAMDKMYIQGHYYSDKSPVPSLAMAAVYKGLELITGIKAADSPALFCYLLTLFFSGVAYVISVCCIKAMFLALDLNYLPRLLLPYSFALATVALPYTRHVNNHILLLAVFSAAMLVAVQYTQTSADSLLSWHIPILGTLAGIGYTIDLGAGPIFVLSIAGFLGFQSRSAKAVIIMLAAAFPWFLLHHALNYMIGGTFKPANSVAEYFLWPGSPFNAQNLTGGWAHKNIWNFLRYALAMLFMKKGFICHNPALFACIPGIYILLRNKETKTALVYSSVALISGTWLIYAATSINYSGLCCSIRWFVPLLAPFYYLLAMFLKKRPDYIGDVLILTAWGILLGILMWIKGPWIKHMVPLYWFIEAATLVSWLMYRLRRVHLKDTSVPFCCDHGECGKRD